jgi:predicted PurR-regulated permease PerM
MTIKDQLPRMHVEPLPPSLQPGNAQPPVVSISWWRMVTAGAMALILGLGTLQLFPLIAHTLALLILAISIAASLAPLVKLLERRMPRLAAILLVYLVIVLVFIGIFQVMIPPLISQAQAIGKQAPEIMARAQETLDSWNLGTISLKESLLPQIGQFSSTLVAFPISIASSLFDIVLVLVISIYWLLSAISLRGYFLTLFPITEREQVDLILREISMAMGGYIRATVINGVIIGGLTFVGLFFIGARYPLVLGLAAGILELIPIVGPIISGILVVAITLLQSPTLALIALIYMFLMQELEGNLLVPNVMGRQTEISPLLAILALYAGAAVGGLLGALIAIPVASAAQVLVRELFFPIMRQWTRATLAESKEG